MTRSIPSNLGAPYDEVAMPRTELPSRPHPRDQPQSELPIPLAARQPFSDFKPRRFAKPFCKFLTNNPTVFHACSALGDQCAEAGYKKLSERDIWSLEKGGKYYVERNGSSLIAFAVGDAYEPGNGAAMIAGHIDALTAKVKPIPTKETKQGFVQLGVAPYAGALNMTWWDRDLAIAGRVMVKENGKIVTKLVNLAEPIAKVPTLAPHFGLPALGPFNPETQMVPIVGLDNSDLDGDEAKPKKASVGPIGSFASTQPPRLVKAIASELGIESLGDIVNWELELYDLQPATLSGFDKEFLSGGRIDDKLCSWSALQALLGSTYSSSDTSAPGSSSSSIIKVVALFDDEEIGSLLRQGARGNFLPSVIERIVDSFVSSSSSSPPSSSSSTTHHATSGANLTARTYANSFLLSADVSHAVNPNFLSVYLEHHSPRLNIGPAVSCDPNGHMTTDAASSALLQQIAEKCGSTLQLFQIRNDSRSGGTVGPMLSARMGVRAIDVGQVQLSMHSIRATTGALDPGLGVKLWKGFFDFYEEVDCAFR